jgi:hypothetical protein
VVSLAGLGGAVYFRFDVARRSPSRPNRPKCPSGALPYRLQPVRRAGMVAKSN